VINGLLLAAVTAVAVANGFDTVALPLWRQLLYLPLVAASYLSGRALPTPWERWVLGAGALAGAGTALADRGTGLAVLFSVGLGVALPWLAGRYLRQQAQLVEAGRDRVARLEREQAHVAERARLRERTRIAEDVHDSLGHALALMALRAGALELAPGSDPAARAAAAELRALAVQATDRLRATLAVLRTGEDPGTAVPDEPVTELVRRAAEAGMRVRTDPEEGPGPLPPLAERAVQRVVREALTNAARYAPGAPVRVGFARSAGRISVSVANGAPNGPAAPAGGGTGLAALRARVELLGGELSAGPEDEGFAVRAGIPLDATGPGERGPR